MITTFMVGNKTEIPTYLLIGSESDKRFREYRQTLEDVQRAEGEPWQVHTLDWLRIVEDAECFAELSGQILARIEAPGEEHELVKAFLNLALRESDPTDCELDEDAIERLSFEKGRFLAPRQLAAGFRGALTRIERGLNSCGGKALNPPAAIRLLFDKVAMGKWLFERGYPTPEHLFDLKDYDDLIARMRSDRIREVYVKLAGGSYAVGIVILTCGSTWAHAQSTMKPTPRGIFNTKRLFTCRSEAQVRLLVNTLSQQGAVVQHAIPKLQLEGMYSDLRVLVVYGEVPFLVCRLSPHKITNLRIGGLRGNVDALRAAIPEQVFAEAMACCTRLADELNCAYLGVDLAFDRSRERYYILEANAFGDFFPNLVNEQGYSTYEYEIRTMRKLWREGRYSVK